VSGRYWLCSVSDQGFKWTGPRQAKIVLKKRKKCKNFMFEDFSLGVEASFSKGKEDSYDGF
jgi:hypothetical protein